MCSLHILVFMHIFLGMSYNVWSKIKVHWETLNISQHMLYNTKSQPYQNILFLIIALTFFLVCFTFSRFCLDWDGFQSHLCRLNPSWIETLRLVLEVAVAAAQEMKNPAKSPPKCPVRPTLAGISRQMAQQLLRACSTLLQEPVSREASKSKFSGVQELKHLDFVCSVF